MLDASADACRTLLAAVARDVDGPLHTTVEASDAARLADLASAGFVPTRRESEYVLDVATALGRLGDASLPTGYVLANVGDVPPDELRVLDDRLRQDVPGTDGWEWDAAGFHDETYDPGQFDPQLYWIAVHQVDGERVGLVRVWRRPEAFRLGLIAVLPRHRRRGISRGLLGHVLGRLDARGVGEVVTEIDDGNEASRGLLIGLGVRRIGGSVELVRGGAAR
ncbi:MAG TPA: GNAT family N-acetyltransferase [Egicoccus sp.]|nr:GNAT family N-acetyltransferase [Egicoccus sp.]HSK23428.1 GNAT family N-acetyltransferase [Egicoccus sp.]